MVNWKNYTGTRNTDEYLSRAKREAFIFEMINHAGNKYTPDNAGENTDARVKLTLSQKKRLRRNIIKSAYELHNANPDKAGQPLDNNDIVQAFFETDYGKRFASKQSDWEEGAPLRSTYEATIASWTEFGDTDISRCLISPYDPMFADSSLFMNRNGADEIAYVVGNIDPKTHKAKLSKNGLSTWDVRCVERMGNTLLMNKVIPGSNNEIITATDDVLWNMHSKKASLSKEIYGPATKCGFTAISKYIRDAAERENIYDYLSSQKSVDIEQIQLMEDICQYLTETGRPFDVKLGNDKKLVARLNDGSKMEIRLFDTDGAYRGRIYDNGKNVYLAASSRLSNGGRAGGATLHQGGYMNSTYNGKSNTALFDEGIIGNDDVMRMIKWYLGENVKIASEIRGSENKLVGEAMKYPVKKYKKSGIETLDYSAIGTNKASQTSSVLLHLSYIENQATTKKWLADETAKINASTTMSAAEKKAAIDELPAKIPYHITDPGDELKARKSQDVIPFAVNAIITGKSTRQNQKTDEEEFANSIVLTPEQREVLSSGSEDTFNERREAMMRTNVRNKLVEWQKSAKQTHRKYVGITDMANTIRTQQIHNEFDYEFSSDDSIKQIQELYWGFLTGKINSLPKTIDTEDGVVTDSEAGVYEVDKSAGFEERLAAVEKHYHDYQQVLFGSMPTFDNLAHYKEVQTAIENGENRRAVSISGFNPAMVAKYVSTPDSQGVQKNYDFIRHMLSRLGDAYTPDMIKGDDYISREIKNDMIRFNDASSSSFRYFAYKGSTSSNTAARETINSQFADRPVTKEMMLYVGDMLAASGCYPDSITLAVDDQGIIKFRGCKNSSKESYKPYDRSKEKDLIATKDIDVVSGEIGQIFEPDEYGAITTRYAGQPNKVMIPGYNAYIVADDEENPKPLGERLRLSGWKQQMRNAIAKEVHAAVFTAPTEYKFLPHTTSLNTVYRKTYETSYSIGEYNYRLNEATPEDQSTFRAIIKTLQGRCRFPNEYGDGATTMAQSMLEHPERQEAKNYDYYYSDLLDNENLRVLGEYFDGIFDENMTGTAKTQGLVRYLVDGAEVDDATGSVKPVPTNYTDENGNFVKAECPLMKDVLFRDKYHDTWDRRQMAASQVLTAQSTPRGVGMAMMNIDGWTFDDGFVVSKKFAQQYHVSPGEDKDRRPLIIGDKLSDMHGNKGVISLVVDPYLATDEIIKSLQGNGEGHPDNGRSGMGVKEGDNFTFWFRDVNYTIPFDTKSGLDEYQQAAQYIQKQYNVEKLDDVMHVFRDNENLDVVASPYSGMSRSNGGSGKGMLDPAPAGKDKILNLPDGRTVDGGIGYVDMIVVDMLADVKTHFYDQHAIREGKGRKASGQLAWVLQAKGADKIMKAFYGSNDSAFSNLREYAIAIGMDFDETGTPKIGYHQQTNRGEKRKLFKSPDPTTIECNVVSAKSSGKKALKFDAEDLNAHMQHMFEELNASGGFMELPFPLEFNTLSYVNLPSGVDMPEGSFKLQKTGQSYVDISGASHDTYGLPVLSHSLRSGQDFQDGTARPHDYTLRYKKIYEAGLKYRKCEEMLLTDGISAEDKKFLTTMMSEQKAVAQQQMNEVTKDIINNRFNTKYNVVREEIMATRIDNSATAVWTADPRLKTDEVAMSLEHAAKLGLTTTNEETGEIKLVPDASVLLWRDPILHDGNVRYMKIVVNDSLTGVAINPLMDKSFDGDFDGDSIGMVALTDKDAKNQAYTCFGVENNLLNHGVDVRGKHPMYVQDGLDVASNSATGTTPGAILDELAVLQTKVNTLESLYDQAMSESDPAKKKSMLDRIEFESEERVKKLDENGKPMHREGSRAFLYEELLDKKGRPMRDADGHKLFKTEIKTYTGDAAMRRYRKQWKQELDIWADKALDGIATDILVGKDEKTMVESLQNIVDHKAKGNQSKMLDYAHNIGIDYQLGADGKADLSTVTSLGGPKDTVDGDYRAIDKKIQETAAYKADNTQLGGTTAQNGVAALRDVDILVALELTYPITQAILQSKHDPKDAKVKDEIVRFWGKDVWDGYKITGLTGWQNKTPEEVQQLMHEKVPYEVYDVNKYGDKVKIPKREFVQEFETDSDGIQHPVYENGKPVGSWEDVYNDDGTPVFETAYQKCTRDEFVDQMNAMMYALKVDINPDYIERLADIMTRPVKEKVPLKNCDGRVISRYNEELRELEPVTGNNGKVIGLTDYAREKGTLLDRMGYTGRATALVQEALKGDQASSIFSAPEALIEYGRQYSMYVTKDKNEKPVPVKLPNSAMFASEKTKTYLADDAEMKNTGKDCVEIRKKVAEIGANINSGKVAICTRKPKPIGRNDTLIHNVDERVPYMGQSQSDYESMLKADIKDAATKVVDKVPSDITLKNDMRVAVMSAVKDDASKQPYDSKMSRDDKVYAVSFEYEDGSKDLKINISETTVDKAAMKYVTEADNVEHGASQFAAYATVDDAIKAVKDIGFGTDVDVSSYESIIDVSNSSDVDKIKSELGDMKFKTYDEFSSNTSSTDLAYKHELHTMSQEEKMAKAAATCPDDDNNGHDGHGDAGE